MKGKAYIVALQRWFRSRTLFGIFSSSFFLHCMYTPDPTSTDLLDVVQRYVR